MGNYYGIMPASVRYDKNLMPMAKILFSEITALANGNGYCWAQNNFFMELYGVSDRQITRWISDLVRCGYVNRVIVYEEGTKQIKERRLYPSDQCTVIPRKKEGSNETPPTDENVSTLPDENVSTPPDENVSTPPDENVSTPPDENVGENNKFSPNNNFLNNKFNFIDDVDEKDIKYFKKVQNYLYDLNRDLIFDDNTVLSFCFFLKSQKLNFKNYTEFVYDYVLKQKPKKLRNYFLTVFSEKSILEIFKKQTKFQQTEKQQRMHTCKVCGFKFESDICPHCLLPVASEPDDEVIKIHKYVATLPQSEKQVFLDKKANEITAAMRKKFGIGV